MLDSDDESISPLSKSSPSTPPLYLDRKSGYGTIDSGKIETPSTLEACIDSLSQVNGISERLPLFGSHFSRKGDEELPAPTLWKHEAKTIIQYTAPMTLTLLLQYSLTTSSIFVVGHLGKQELGAVSLANMTAIITGYAVYQGFSTSLDTLCPQAYGSGKLRQVGLHTLRVTLLLLIATIPISIIWMFSPQIFKCILPSEDPKIAILAGTYLRVALIGAPGFACFEAGKRFVQAQGLFHASLHVLLFCAPLNALMSWYFVWKLQWGFIGAPIAVAITQLLLPILLALYVRLTTTMECWHPLTTEVFKDWRPMMKLAIPGLVNIEAEFLAWEILTLVSSYLGSTALATQSALYVLVCTTYMISFSASIGSGTRIATLIGAGLERRAVVAARVALCLAATVGLVNFTALITLKSQFPKLFTDNVEVSRLMEKLIPLCASLQVFDALNCSCNGILRAVGRPEIGSYIQLTFYYGLSLPLGIWLAFWGPDWGLMGIWVGMVLGLFGIAACELGMILRIDWERAILEAWERNRG